MVKKVLKRERKKEVSGYLMTKLKMVLLILLLLILTFSLANATAPATIAEGEGEKINLIDVFTLAENIQQNFEKLMIKNEIDDLNAANSGLKEENEELTKKISDLQNRMKNTNESIEVINSAKEDSIFKWISIFFFFALGAFISSLLFTKVVWKIKIEGRN